MPTLAVETEALVKRYPKVEALGGVTLAIEPGEIFALLGPNGAGKTTWISIVCGLTRATAGSARVLGHDVVTDALEARKIVGLVPQEINFDPFFTVQESLEIQLGYYGQKVDRLRIAELLEALKLSDKAKARTRQLSGGMKRRLLIAKALVHRPKLVFLDEPTAGVDVELRRDLWEYVRKLKAEGTTIILTTHYLEEAEELADRGGLIDDGRLQLIEDKAALMRRLGERRLLVTFSARVPALPPAAERAGAVLSMDGLQLRYVERTGQLSSSQVLGALYAGALPVLEVETRRSRLEDILLSVLRGPHAHDERKVPA